MSVDKFNEYLDSVMDDPHESDATKELIAYYRVQREALAQKHQKREVYWQTYTHQQANDFVKQLEAQKKNLKAEVMVADIKTAIAVIALILMMITSKL